jgi:hypothetical protein
MGYVECNEPFSDKAGCISVTELKGYKQEMTAVMLRKAQSIFLLHWQPVLIVTTFSCSNV